MSTLCVFLFGKFQVQSGERLLTDLGARKVQELFCYLLIYRDRPHPRETLAGLLWGENSTAQSKSYLRKALWQIQAALDSPTDPINSHLLLADSDWVELNPVADLWLDVAVFERAFTDVQNVPGQELDSQRAQTLQNAVNLYRGDLLEGWYQDWCLYERERLQYMYLAMLDKLMGYCEKNHQCEAGLAYGTLILRYDRARERTHRRLMRLYCMAGDRTAALRQYERCVAALDEELDVRPSKRTVALYKRIQSDQLYDLVLAPAEDTRASEAWAFPLAEVLEHLRQRQAILADVQRQIQQDIQTVELALARPHEMLPLQSARPSPMST